MTTWSMRLRFVAGALAIATLALPGQAAHAFTFQTVTPTNPDGSPKLVDPDNQTKNRTTVSPFGANGPTLQFGRGPMSRAYGAPPRPFNGGDNE